jgi:uncharacterized delta-60 repeat protein
MKTLLSTLLAALVLCTVASTRLAAAAGDVDTTFVANTNSGSYVRTVAVQPDGKILVGGNFTSIGGTAHNGLARLNSDSSLDVGFNPGVTGAVNAVLVLDDGQLVIAGSFTAVGGTARAGLARLSAAGVLDATFNPGLGNVAYCLGLQPDGKIVVGGNFTTIAGTARPRLARLNNDGTLDSTFAPALNNNFVTTLAIQPDEKILIGGNFTTVDGSTRNSAARLNADGSLDSFNPNVLGSLESIAVQTDGKVILGGNNVIAVGGVTRNQIARVHADGTLDTTFNPNSSGAVFTLAFQTDGELLLGGSFTSIGASTRNRIARLNADATVDSDFAPSISAEVYGLALDASGKVLVGGGFTQVNTSSRARLARLENGPATQPLTVPSSTSVQWLRGGSAPETFRVTFDLSTDGGTSWTPLGLGTRISGGWTLAGLTLPGTGHVRARARTISGRGNGSSGLVEVITPFIVPIPEIEVAGGSLPTVIPAADTAPTTGKGTDFGSVVAAGTAFQANAFTIRSLGTGQLTVTSVTSSNPAEFAVSGFTPGPILPTANTPFTVTFDPSGPGTRTGTITIASDDSDEASTTFLVQGNGLTFPEIAVRGGTPTQLIASGDILPESADGTQFPVQALTAGLSAAQTFKIHNDGDATLTVTSVTSGNPEFIPSNFTPGPIAPNAFATFDVRFDPAVAGLRTSTITIANDDADESSYTFLVQGNGGVADMSISGKSVIIPDGDTTPTGDDDTDFFGRSVCASGTTSHTFTIRNTGFVPLTITAFGKSGAHAGDFTINAPTLPLVLAGPSGIQTFTVDFDPTAGGTRNAVIEVTHDGPGGPVYNFTVSGQGTGPEIELWGGSPLVAIPHNTVQPTLANHTHFGDVTAAGTVTLTRTFTLRNTGDAPLTISSINSSNTPEFLIVATFPVVIPPAQQITFDVVFDPAEVGVRASDLWIVNDDCDEPSYTIRVRGNGVGYPEIDLRGGLTPVSIPQNFSGPISANGTHFGSYALGAGPTAANTFRIHNTGDVNLTVTAITSVNSAEFPLVPLSPPLPAVILPGGNYPFQVKFDPNQTGTRTGTLSVTSDDSDESPYVFAVEGTGTAAPRIRVDGGLSPQSIPNGDFQPESADYTDWGTWPLSGGFLGPRYLHIRNVGDAPLAVTSLTSSEPNEFYIIGISRTLPTTLLPGEAMFFGTYFDPAASGERTATISILNNDPVDHTYLFGVKGNGSAFPEIELRGLFNRLILDQDLSPELVAPFDGTLFPSLQLTGPTASQTFTIRNLGDAPLTVTGIQSSNLADFTVTAISPPLSTPIPPNGNKTFQVVFDPNQPGIRTAHITLHNDDADEFAYKFAVRGTGLPDGTPNIAVTGNGNPVLHLSTGTALSNWTSFGGVLTTGNATLTRTFYITNTGTGTAPLVLGTATLAGVNAGDFGVVTQPAASVLPGDPPTPITVSFNPGGDGNRFGELKIPTNIPGKNPYTFALMGVGNAWTQVAPAMTVSGNATVIPDGASSPVTANHTHFGSTAVSGGLVPRTFTIRNTGQNTLNLTGTPRVQISGLHAGDFTVVQPTVSSLATNATATFTVTFNPSSWSPRNATLSIPNNDTPRNPYNFALRGTGSLTIFTGGSSGFSFGSGNERWTPITGTTGSVGFADEYRSAVASPAPFAWGANAFGQLGLAPTASVAAPTAVPAAGALVGKTVVALAAGARHTVALCSDGTLVAWGQGTSGQLGHGATTDSATPVAVTASGALAGKSVVAIAAGQAHTLALCSDGTVVAWGEGSAGQLGSGFTASSAVPVAVTTTGALAGKTVLSVAAGELHSLALCSDGTVAAWGGNNFGQLGNNSLVTSAVPVLVPFGGALAGKTVVAVAAGGYHTLVSTADGLVAAWGRNSAGQLGDSTNTDRLTPVLVATTGPLAGRTVVFLAAGAAHSLALCSDDTVLAWGDNASGQLGNNSTTASLVPVAVDGTGALAGRTPVALSAGAQHSLVRFADGTSAGWGFNAQSQLGVPASSPVLAPVSPGYGAIVAGSRLAALVSGPAAAHTVALAAAPAPELTLRGQDLIVLDGTVFPRLVDGTDFGSAATGLGTVTRTFTLTNTGGASLTLTGTPRVAIGGAHAADFALLTPPPASVAALGGTASFTIAFSPAAAGLRSATLTFATNDPAHPQFTFAVQGTGSVPGSLALGTNLNANNAILAPAVQPDGRTVLGGNFTGFGAATPRRIARLQADGALDLAFNPDADGNVEATLVQADGSLVLGGSFTSVGGVARNRLARVGADGALDPAFNPDADGSIRALALQPDGKLLVAGNFTTLGGVARGKIARLLANGTLDSAFNPNANRAVYAVAVQPDGKILLAGNFDQVAGTTRQRLARVHADGTLDTTFDPAPNSDVTSLALQADGRIVLAGQFTTVGGITRNRVARLHPDGSLDNGFDPNVDSAVYTLAAQADGKVILGGAFNTVGGVTRTRLARLNANGTPDPTFVASADDDVVFGAALHADGRLVISGYFLSINSTSRHFVALLDNGPATQSLALTSNSRVQWLRGGTAPETQHVTFERSIDGGATWTLLGAGTRLATGGGWELTGQTFAGTGLIRARARTTGGAYTGSSGLVEAIVGIDVAIAPAIVTPPTAQTATVGGSATFTVVAGGNPAPTLQWGRASAMGVTPIPGATAATFTLDNVQTGDAGSYAVVVTNASGSVTSPPVPLTVTAAPLPPVITTAPLPRVVRAGEAASFAVVATGAAPLTYQWRKAGSPISGATQSTLAFLGTAAADAGSYDVEITNAVGSVTSAPVSLTVLVSPAIAVQPISRGVGTGTGVVFSVTATGTAPFTYQWSKDGSPLSGATLATLSLANVTSAAAGVYHVAVSNLVGTVLSTPATLAVIDAFATHAVGGPGYLSGGTVTITNTLTYGNTASGLGWQVLLPVGFRYASGSGYEGEVKPAPGATNLLEWAWTTIPTSPLVFTYTLNVPAGTSGDQLLAALAIVRQAGVAGQILAKPDPLVVGRLTHHSADTSRDYSIGLVELTRVIELYNTRIGTTRTGCYRVLDGSEDGFAPDDTRPGSTLVTLSRYHTGDSNRDGRFSLLELTRVIELFNTRSGTTRTGQYHVAAGTEDGFAPGP